MNCPNCGYSDRFRTAGFNLDSEYARAEDVSEDILEALTRQDPVQVGRFVYHRSRGNYVYRMLREAWEVSDRKHHGKGVFARSDYSPSPRKTPMKALQKMLNRKGIVGSQNVQEKLT